MAAEPMPASFENAARWNPRINTPINPPVTPSGSERMGENGTDGKWNFVCIHGQNDQGADQVEYRHEWNDFPP